VCGRNWVDSDNGFDACEACQPRKYDEDSERLIKRMRADPNYHTLEEKRMHLPPKEWER
jgi:hypothetical protein